MDMYIGDELASEGLKVDFDFKCSSLGVMTAEMTIDDGPRRENRRFEFSPEETARFVDFFQSQLRELC